MWINAFHFNTQLIQGILGEPGTSASFNWTLAWNNFDGAWVLREGRRKHASVRSNALSPVEILCPIPKLQSAAAVRVKPKPDNTPA